eukprot:Opistho-1_new@33896
MYNWQLKDWPHFSYQIGEESYARLLQFQELAGQMKGTLHALPPEAELDAIIENMVAEAVNSAAIEGEVISRPDVRSSIRNKLQLGFPETPVFDQQAIGMGQLMTLIRASFADPLQASDIQNWHQMLFSSTDQPWVGKWRTHEDPMQVVSGFMGKQKVHFEAPPSNKVPAEMEAMIAWFNQTAPGNSTSIIHAPERAAVAHLYFESIHPFEDGNGRIGRALAEKALSQTLGRPAVCSLSMIIEANRKEYYRQLENAQQKLEISEWMDYFIEVILQAQLAAVETVVFSLAKNKFFAKFRGELTERQLKVVRRMLDEGREGFKGGMNATKYQGITGVSKATATRDLQELAAKGVFVLVGGGRSTRYNLYLE